MRPVFLAPVALLVLAFPLLADPVSVTPAERTGKARLVEVLRAGLREDRQRVEALRGIPGLNGKTPPADRQARALDPAELRRNLLDAAARRERALRALLGAVEQEDASLVPARLTSLFLSCGPHGCRDGLLPQDVDEFIVAFGAPALQPLLDVFGTLDASKKESVLRLLLRVEPGLCPKAVLEGALSDPVFRVRSAALEASRRNCAPAGFQRSLEALLARETDPEFLLYLLEQVSREGGRNAWRYDELIRLVQGGRIPAEKAFGQLCSAILSGEKPDATDLNVPFWLEVFETHASRRACLVQNLFLGLDQERPLAQLRRLFLEAAGNRYLFGSVEGLYGPAAAKPASYWDSIPGADERMLALFQAHLGPRAMRAWKDAPETPLGVKLLLGRWLGEDPAALLPRTLRLRIEVRSTDDVVSAAAREVTLDRPFGFVLPPLAPGFQEVGYRGTVWFDSVRLCFGIRDFVVGLRPAGAGFAPVIPVDGLFRASLISQGKTFVWEIRVSPP
jgi:hypothetical protein